jgi:hypothetical protein
MQNRRIRRISRSTEQIRALSWRLHALTSRRIEPHKVIGSSGSRRRGGPVEADWGSVFFQPNCLRYLGDLIHGIMMEKVSNEQIRI